MATLGSIYHDFPRLAKQSGFYFQLHSGRVNWSEIESLDINEIIEKRNFQLLEDNLINVINCNLEREYDIKILDPNFVKLFKLAQLGVDYLSYCEMYLDKCVVLLQEQLTAFQDEFESLKQENQKRKEEMNRNKKKNKTQSHQCEKCEKVFISDVYLKFHDKRRHSTPNTPNSSDSSQKKCTDSWQQTEEDRKLSTSTQTLEFNEVSTTTHEDEDKSSLKIENISKIEKLEQELQDLKGHLKKAESFLSQRTEASQSNVFHPLNVPGPICYNPMLMLLPSYLQQTGNSQSEINSAPQISVPVPELNKPDTTILLPSDKSEPTESKLQPQTSSQLSTEKEKNFSKQDTKSYTEYTVSFQECQTAGTETLEEDKENLNPNTNKSIVTNTLIKPLPPPRKLKKGTQIQAFSSNKISETTEITDSKTKEEETAGFASRSIVYKSTPIKKVYEETDSEIFDEPAGDLAEINKIETNSTESLDITRSALTHGESESLIKKIVTKNSPKLRNLSKNIKRSLTNIYDSVSSTEKDSNKQNLRTAVTNQLNNRLRDLGVDPEWDGIPKKTFRQKLSDLKHRRKLLSKENPMYPIIRRNIEEKIFQKLKNNFRKKKPTLINKLSKQQSMDVDEAAVADISFIEKPDFVKVKNCTMYDIESDSESKISVSEQNLDLTPEQNNSPKSVVLEELSSSSETEEKVDVKKPKDFDFSVFQVGGRNLNGLVEDTLQKRDSVNKTQILSDSDIDENFLQQPDEKLFKISHEINEKNAIKNHETIEDQLNFPNSEKTKSDNHSILKGNYSRLSTNGKKKVLFANYSDGIEEELSDSPLDDDLWPFKSDSEKDVG